MFSTLSELSKSWHFCDEGNYGKSNKIYSFKHFGIVSQVKWQVPLPKPGVNLRMYCSIYMIWGFAISCTWA